MNNFEDCSKRKKEEKKEGQEDSQRDGVCVCVCVCLSVCVCVCARVVTVSYSTVIYRKRSEWLMENGVYTFYLLDYNLEQCKTRKKLSIKIITVPRIY